MFRGRCLRRFGEHPRRPVSPLEIGLGDDRPPPVEPAIERLALARFDEFVAAELVRELGPGGPLDVHARAQVLPGLFRLGRPLGIIVPRRGGIAAVAVVLVVLHVLIIIPIEARAGRHGPGVTRFRERILVAACDRIGRGWWEGFLAAREAAQRGVEILGEGVGGGVGGELVEAAEMREQQPVRIAAAGGDDLAVVEHLFLDPVDRAASEHVLRIDARGEQRGIPGEAEPPAGAAGAVGGLVADPGGGGGGARRAGEREVFDESDLPLAGEPGMGGAGVVGGQRVDQPLQLLRLALGRFSGPFSGRFGTWGRSGRRTIGTIRRLVRNGGTALASGNE